VKRSVTRIRDLPEAWPTMSRRSRRCRVTRFPYGLVYQVTSNEIRILAVAHLHRRQYYWRGRE
jgi:mRNA-degrading endonuclease RelE of RelBE toxin-antitoxin system